MAFPNDCKTNEINSSGFSFTLYRTLLFLKFDLNHPFQKFEKVVQFDNCQEDCIIKNKETEIKKRKDLASSQWSNDSSLW